MSCVAEVDRSPRGAKVEKTREARAPQDGHGETGADIAVRARSSRSNRCSHDPHQYSYRGMYS
jgi:hypothetical protein